MKDISEHDLHANIPLVSRKDTVRDIRAGSVSIDHHRLVVMAGPCTVEGKAQIDEIAAMVREAGADMLRGGVFKPLTFPYNDPLIRADADDTDSIPPSVRVISKKELCRKAERRFALLKEAGEKYNLPIISEIIYADTMEMMSNYVDMFQVGYRHMFNMDLIEVLATTTKPVMIKRHYGESLRSLLGVGEHFDARGKHNFIFCERGIAAPHTHNQNSRAVIDIQAIPALNEYAPSVPVFVDPSHATFRSRYVPPVARAAIAAGADGLLIEVHPAPDKAWVDPLNAINFDEFSALMKQLRAIKSLVKGS